MMFRRLSLLATLGLALASPALAQGNNPDFTLRNGGLQPINEIYVSSSAVSAWGNDRLGANILAPGAGLAIVLPADQCRNDIKVVFADGATRERRGVNTCELNEVSFP
jgi:hypothetical protein